ncbi:hypothetical protein RDI40_00310 (plasmid) [Enterobacter hormaechei]|uniref:hypothetical protein n=1 Tax=Enterobacter hormaechei TaxID=158836 RepID=UPI002B4BF919|nr:hypothetical protein [Enterobacter hormaechei]WRL98252.1 hypothetical protein RDI40_00310 [Enterobacter hormaechei]
MKLEAARTSCRKLAISPDTSPGAREILFKFSGAVAADKGVGQRARCKVGVSLNFFLQILRLFAMRKLSVSFFYGGSHGGALREICDFAGGFTGENLRNSTTK